MGWVDETVARAGVYVTALQLLHGSPDPVHNGKKQGIPLNQHYDMFAFKAMVHITNKTVAAAISRSVFESIKGRNDNLFRTAPLGDALCPGGQRPSSSKVNKAYSPK